MQLSEAQRDTFFEDGFVIIPNVFSPQEIERMRMSFERLLDMARSLEGKVIHEGAQFVVEQRPHQQPPFCFHRVGWCGAVEPYLLEIGRSPKLLKMVSQLLGSQTVVHLLNQAHYKQPHDGLAFPWHQDSYHRRYGTSLWEDLNEKGSYVQTAIALDDVTEENGPLEFIPGSWRKGHIVREVDEQPPFDVSSAVKGLMSTGDVVMFGPFTFHRSMPNESTSPRRILINGYAYPGANAREYTGSGTGIPLQVETSS
ncbi:MAG TPA: hypothetical protein DCE42_25925 [Myxococcales bacterium]|nr:hypothetical protein [Deltaproteobacteria bacterium]MBU48571.1 hypothetical protein [Deltaproteobacteria bacterium]HAA58229.1 hypothetical protein [Myxococcales bacterium]|tara:strand:+ start:5349 stop:6113 length:765 start_codon:yes stop_codon:yes gene_type:complete